MFKITCLCVIFFCCFSLRVNAVQVPVKRDNLSAILKINNPDVRERELVLFLQRYFGEMPKNHLNEAQVETVKLLEQYNIADRVAIGNFIESLRLMRLDQYKGAEKILIRAIALAEENDYLLYSCFTHLGFIQTYHGHMTDAISSFRTAKKEAALVNDAYMQVLIDINISDIYYRMNLYSQALFYLRQAQSLLIKHHITEPKLKNALNNNKAETYFRMGNIDSLKKYNEVLNATKTGTYRLYSYQKRTNYYVDLLEHRYLDAISQMRRLRKDSLYRFDATDEQNLADAYFSAGMSDSASVIINRLLASEAQNNHPEIRSHLYETLGLMAEGDHDYGRASFNFKLALQQAKEQIARLTRVDTIAAQIKIDEMQGAYIQKAEIYKRERMWMGFAIIITVMGLIIGALSYRSIKRKKYYEQLLFTAKKEELAFINSHEVRRHLSNILGVIDTIKQSSDKHQGYLEAEEHLLNAAGDLDKAIKSISAKLDN